jgi:hypothetical protein
MTALRTTWAKAILGLGVGLFGPFGCGHEPQNSTSDEAVAVEPEAIDTERPQLASLPPPRSEWIEYSANDRKLSLYQLRASGRWMIKRSDRETAYPIGPEHVLPEGLNPATTIVYYTRPNGLTSRGVSLAQIQATTREHVSLARE